MALSGCGGSGSSGALGATIAISPKAAAVSVSATQIFKATVTHVSDSDVAWLVEEGPARGTITAYGVYTAPAGTYHVLVRSSPYTVESPFAIATVTVK